MSNALFTIQGERPGTAALLSMTLSRSGAARLVLATLPPSCCHAVAQSASCPSHSNNSTQQQRLHPTAAFTERTHEAHKECLLLLSGVPHRWLVVTRAPSTLPRALRRRTSRSPNATDDRSHPTPPVMRGHTEKLKGDFIPPPLPNNTCGSYV